MSDVCHCQPAADLLAKRLDLLEHPEGVVRLTQFSHDSPGLRKLRKQIAEGVVLTLEHNGFTITADSNAGNNG